MNAGIICELNPPHVGHAKLIADTKNLRRAGGVVAVMSGNFVQRGEAAIYAKHVRAEAAIRLGIDLVLELPVISSLNSAQGFAEAGVALFQATGVVEEIFFGSESADIDAISRAAATLDLPQCEQLTRMGLDSGLSYGAARQAAVRQLLGDAAEVLTAANDMLGAEYIRASAQSGANFKFSCLPRVNGVSATAIRSAIVSGAEPLGIAERFDLQPMTARQHELAMLSRLRAMSADDFGTIRGASDAMAERAAKYASAEPSVEAVAAAIKTKRYAMSRVRRFLMCAALGIRADEPVCAAYIRVLAANETGRGILRDMQSRATLPIITKPAAAKQLSGAAQRMMNLEAAATDFYNLGFDETELRRGGAEWRTSPHMM